jgi:ribosomal protein S18 acetylase RimI-like enzyme
MGFGPRQSDNQVMAPCDEIFHIRRARETDARAIAQVHIQTWRDAYRRELPASFLAGLSVDNRERMWHDEIKVLPTGRRPWVAETASEIIGFISAGASRSDAPQAGEGEVYAIYVLPDCWARGIGRNLLAHAERDLVDYGYTQAILWCFAANDRARKFYEQMGWHHDGGSMMRPIAGLDLEEVRYRIKLDRARVAATA